MPGPREPAITLHGVFIEIFGLGVLIAGRSGAGKSELALELVGRGHRLIADDVAEFEASVDGGVIGRCPPLLYGFLEVRGLGVVNVGRMFGEAALRHTMSLDLILRLDGAPDPDEVPDRLHARRTQVQVCGQPIAQIHLPRRALQSVVTLAEVACRDQRLRIEGYDAAADFIARQARSIEESGR